MKKQLIYDSIRLGFTVITLILSIIAYSII